MWEKLKKFLAIDGKAIIVEDGEPRYVVLPADEYLALKSASPSSRERDFSQQQSRASGDPQQQPPQHSQPQSQPAQFRQRPAADPFGLEDLDLDETPDALEAASNEINLDDLV